jgi:hypothetical protein
MAQYPAPGEGIVLTHFVALANSWIIINVGGGPTDDKPTVILETPRCYIRDPDGYLIEVGQPTVTPRMP